MPDTNSNTPNPSDAPHLSRRFALTAPLMLAAPTLAAEANPDAEVVRLAADFIAEEAERERRLARFCDLPQPYSSEASAEYETFAAIYTGYDERMAKITVVDVTTRAGLLAQAEVMLWHSKNPSSDERHLWNLADSVFLVMGVPLPDWALSNN